MFIKKIVALNTTTFLYCRLYDNLHHMMLTTTLTRALPLAVYSVLVTVERYHLFVWTVFSPKLLYEGMTTLVVFCFCWILAFILSINKSWNRYFWADIHWVLEEFNVCPHTQWFYEWNSPTTFLLNCLLYHTYYQSSCTPEPNSFAIF